jgi:hypothetical protein
MVEEYNDEVGEFQFSLRDGVLPFSSPHLTP